MLGELYDDNVLLHNVLSG